MSLFFFLLMSLDFIKTIRHHTNTYVYTNILHEPTFGNKNKQFRILFYPNLLEGIELSTSTVTVPVTAFSVLTITLHPTGGRATTFGKPTANTE